MNDIDRIDEVLTYFYNNQGNVTTSSIIDFFQTNDKPIAPNAVIIILQKMVDDKVIEIVPFQQSIYRITYYGVKFYNDGKYAMHNLRLEAKEEIAFKKQMLEIDQLKSVVDTNTSVQQTNEAIRENIPVQNRIARTSLIVSGISLAFVLATVYQNCTNTTSQKLQDINQTLKDQSKAIEGLKTSRPNADFYPKKTEKDSANR